MESAHPNEVTLCMAYYENPAMLRYQLAHLTSFASDLKEQLRIILVDDGSPDCPAESVVNVTPPCGMPLSLYRMDKDIRWNQDACRNLAASEAETRWLLMTDIDHLVPEQTWRRLVFNRLSWKIVYTFNRVTGPAKSRRNPHPNTWLLTTDRFEATGGYDERFAGWYGTDGDFKRRLQRVAQIQLLPELIEEVTPDMIGDCRTTRYERKTPDDRQQIAKILAQRGNAKPLRGLCPWHKVLP